MNKLVLAMLLLVSPALAQTPQREDSPARQAPSGEIAVETIYSDAQRARDEDLSRRFIQSLLAQPYSLEGQFAKWTREICPTVFGLSPGAAYMVERRIREVAQKIGAPQDRRDPCPTNISIIVTDDPQAKLDALAAIEPLFFAAAPKAALKVTQPVSVFYTTFLRDFGGLERLDVPWEELGLEGPAQVQAKLSRLGNGIQPVMAGAIVIVDTKAVMGRELGTLGDYFSLLVLSQAPHTGRCQPAPSIANLMAAGCKADVRTSGLSEVDLAMLTGLYQTPLEPELLQRARIVGNMRKALEAEFTAGQR
jgi:hypothetical protein